MRLSKFEIRNFRNLGHVSFNWEDIVVLIGENNVGKSSVLEALEWFLSGRQIKDEALFRNGVTNSEHAIELTGYFDQLIESEQQQVAIRGRMFQNQWILKKRFWLSEGGDKEKWEEQYFSYHEQAQFRDWPDSPRSWTAFPDAYQPVIEMVKAEGSARVSGDSIDRLKQLVREHRPDLISSATDWVANPGGGGNWKSNANSVLPRLVKVEAVHAASSELQAKNTTAYGQILQLLLEKRLARRPEISQLKEQLAKVRALFRPDPEHPEWEQAPEIADVQQRISDRLAQHIVAQAKIIPTEMNLADFIVPNTVMKLDDGFETEVTGQGHGLQRSLIMALLQVLVEFESEPDGEEPVAEKSVIFAVEEPELYMHPQMERKVRDSLYALAASPNYQVICTTHSPVFLDMAQKHTAIVRLERDADRTIKPFQVTHALFQGEDAEERKRNLRLITEFDPAVNELFFAKRVVLVEGDTEIAVFYRAAELLGLFEQWPHLRRDTTFINCHGKWTIPLFLEVLNHFRVCYLVFHDEDQSKERAAAANGVIGGLVAAPNQRRMFSPENIESVLGYEADKKDKPLKALTKLEDLVATGALPELFQDHVLAAWGVDPAAFPAPVAQAAVGIQPEQHE